jgi:hypothetical protein
VGDKPICCRYIMVEPQTPLGVNTYHKHISSVFCTLTLIDCECVYGTTLSQMPPLSLGSIYTWLNGWASKPKLDCFTNPFNIYKYKVFLHLDKLGMGIWHHP